MIFLLVEVSVLCMSGQSTVTVDLLSLQCCISCSTRCFDEQTLQYPMSLLQVTNIIIPTIAAATYFLQLSFRSVAN
jgi:hypothetical protein